MKTRRFLVIAFCAFAAALSLTFGVRRFAAFGSLAGHIVPAAPEISSLVRSLRPSYPYSVIPGGAYSAAELHYANQTDAVVRAHYATFNMKLARTVQLTGDRFQYASYRIKDQIYWTRKKLRIRKGEYLLTDGVAFTRDALRKSALRNAPGTRQPARTGGGSACRCLPFGPKCCPRWNWPRLLVWVKWRKRRRVSRPYCRIRSKAFPSPKRRRCRLICPQPPVSSFVPPVVRHPPPTFDPPPPVNHPPPILPVPEPSTVGLFVLTFCISLWAMTRVLPAGKQATRQPEHPAE